MNRNVTSLASLGVLSVSLWTSLAPNAWSQFPCGCHGWMPTGEISMQGFNPAWDITQPDAIYLTVNVPEDAVVQVNGDPTAMVGATRYFVIRHLDPEREYKFVISAVTLNAAGIPLEEKKTLVLAAGSRESVSLAPYKRKIELSDEEGAEAEEPSAEASQETPALPDTTQST